MAGQFLPSVIMVSASEQNDTHLHITKVIPPVVNLINRTIILAVEYAKRNC